MENGLSNSTPKLGCPEALQEVERWLKGGKTSLVVDTDVQSYFDSIDSELMIERISERMSNNTENELIEAFIASRDRARE